ncbi:DUF6350 family protein [Oryzobacter sp. 24SJ04S-52]|uniref:cell division protein PerM n=1 Tax=Oryzobacter telluris TaxID=3149179 RepID=UPI00370D0A0F
MTVIDRLRAHLPGSDDPAPAEAHVVPAPPWWRGVVIGLVTGVASLLLVGAPVVLAWLVDPLSVGTAWQAAGTGAALWFLMSGGHLLAGTALLSLVPLLGLALLVLLARVGVREAMVDVSTDGEYWGGVLPRPLAAAVGSWWGGFLLALAGAIGLTTAGPLRVDPLSVVVPAAVLPLAAIALALRPVVRDDPEVLGPALDLPWLPDDVRRGVRPGLTGAAVLLGVGAAVVGLVVALGWSRVATISGEVGAPGLGTLLLGAAQALSLPNLSLWAVSFLAGPGFEVVEGGAVTWSGSEGGLLPLVPVLAALPQPGEFPWVTGACVLVVVAVGGFVARRALGEVARLSRLRTKLTVATVACATCAIALGLLDVLGGGSAGQFRLSDVGVPTAAFVVAVFGWLMVGALVVVVRDAWRLRR